MGIWARTLDKTAEAGSRQIAVEDHCRRSSSPEKRERNTFSGEPANDDRFVGVFAHELEHTGGYTPEDARNVAKTLLPDILSYDPRDAVSPAQWPDLTDDVADLFFSSTRTEK